MAYADDPAIVCGLARLDGQPVAVIGHQKGRDTKDKIYRNFGMPRPEGYRKALRVMKLAERFQLPIICLIDTPGAYPGIGAEERGQSEAIARNLFEMAQLKTPIICTVIGEGGSGGALAVGVGDRLLMLEYSTYAVISPEGCASILWKSADKAQLAAEAMGITSDRVREQGFLDEVVREPIGGGHRDFDKVALNLREALLRHLDDLTIEAQNMDQLLEKRYQRIMRFGSFIEEPVK
jgi:acetyl-CoA carboxylase carboxyl transferase subunit alpha